MTLRSFFSSAFLLLALSLLPIRSAAQWTAPNPVVDFQKQSDGILLHQKIGTLRFQVCSAAIIHLTYSPTADFPASPNPVILKTTWPQSDWKLDDGSDSITLSTSAIKILVDRKTGAITYTDSSGKVLLHDDSKTMTPVTVNGEQTYRAEDYMTLGGYGSTEAIYGLGQHQAGVWNYRGESVDLSQDNTTIAVPLWFPATATESSGTTCRAAASTIASCMIFTSAPKWPTPSTTTSSTVPISTRSLPATAS